jgi:hypothetical protein
MQIDGIKWWPTATITKFNPDTVAWATRKLGHEPTVEELAYMNVPPDDVLVVEGNGLTTAGLTLIASLITGTGAAFTSTLGFAGVGNGTTAFAGGQTDLQGASKYFKGLSAGPTPGAGTIAASAQFASGEANYAWEEWCWGRVASGTVTGGSTIAGTGTSPVMINRKVQALGTKVSGAVWTLAATVTLT